MQQLGEHANCGDGVKESGFSYDPSEFMKNGIYFYNFSWYDFSVGSLGSIMDAVIVIQFALLQGKVAIHCHAGLGRTGVIIACYLIFNNRMSASEAINYVRHKRPGSVQTEIQVCTVMDFEKFISPYRMVFCTSELTFSLETFLLHQRALLHGRECKILKNIPKILFVCFRKLFLLTKEEKSTTGNIKSGHLTTTCGSSGDRSTRFDRSFLGDNVIEVAPRLDEMKNDGDSFNENSLPERTETVHSSTESSSISINLLLSVRPAVRNVVLALLTERYSEDLDMEVDRWKKRFNTEPGTWNEFTEKVDDPLVISKLAFDWLQCLKYPILRTEDLQRLSDNYSDNILETLELFPIPVACTLTFLARFLVSLRPLPADVESLLISRFLDVLTQSRVAYPPHIRTHSSQDSGSLCTILLELREIGITLITDLLNHVAARIIGRDFGGRI
ncbi:unnamed protein product [Calicophoron daubneyi]